ncbi:MAG: LptF/LptG family permease [Coprobacter sp.]|nr:LptF/LptG family permease [Coprobacter sp.]
MFRIKRLYTFILQTFLPVFLMTFFICLFIVLMQFLWKYIDEMVGKGIEMSVLAELFFYAAITLIPMSLPLALLLASLMTFGNLGERLELLAIKAAGVSLLHVMRPLIVVISIIVVGAFFFQNNVLPKAQVKMWTLLYSVRQKSPELDIPEGVFYDQIKGYNLFVKHKNIETGIMYDMVIYDVSNGFEDVMMILADSGQLKLTDDKQFLFLTLYHGESFENLKTQRQNARNVPYRRETFTQKEILIPFDANFNRMDDGIMQNQYIGKDMHALRTSVDSMNVRVDSIGQKYGNDLKRAGYFTIYEERKELAETQPVTYNVDSLYASESVLRRKALYERAIARAENIRRDFEFKGMVITDEKRTIRRHEIEMHKKFTLSFACLIFFFIGAPLGAIIRKGGLGMPVIVSVLLFIFYYIIDNSGYKLARDGRWPVWEGIWLSSAVLLPLGIFLTGKAVKDSAVFNRDAYANFLRRLIGRRETRSIALKEVVIDDMIPSVLLDYIDRLDALCRQMQAATGDRRQSYFRYWTAGYDRELLLTISHQLEQLVEYAQNTKSQPLINKLAEYPVLRNLYLYRPAPSATAGKWLALLLPLALPAYLLGSRQQAELRSDIAAIRRIGEELKQLIHNEEQTHNTHTEP